ncbi:hypothetical protein OAT67_08415 [Bacteriovoracaceae bacterium]|nr:hypothetical protein [Bacteriovoracaceae bacterium]
MAAQSSMLVIAGGADAERHKTVSKLAYEQAEKVGMTSYLSARNGDWDFAESGKSFSSTSASDVEESIKAASKNLKPGESLTIFINDHGGAPDSESSPESSTVVLYNTSWNPFSSSPELTHKDLESLIKKYVPNNKVNLVGIHCFAGGLHTISMNLPNVCSSGSADFRSVTTSTSKINLYGQGFMNELTDKKFDLNGDSATSLLEAHYAATYNDPMNGGRGSLSSESFIDKVLGSGAYDLNNTGMPFMSFLSGTSHTQAPLEIALNGEASLVCKASNLNKDIDKVYSLAKLVTQLMTHVETNLNSLPIPNEVKQAITTAKRKWRENDMANIIEKYRSDYKSLKSKWDSLSYYQQFQNRSTYTKKFDDLEEKAAEMLIPVYTYYSMLQYARKINKFFNSNPAQKDKKKLINLMKCEVGTL